MSTKITTSTTIATTDLKPGDVFIYQSISLVSRLTRLFDGINCSHASIHDGVKVAEALRETGPSPRAPLENYPHEKSD